jgi:KDO2-lipid IV(A) lauroyltransferase
MSTALRHRIEDGVVAGASALVRRAPRRVVLAVGGAAGMAAYLIDARHRRVTLENLRLALGREWNDSQRRRIARRCWAHFGRILLDTLAFPRFSAASAGAAVHYEGLEHIRAAYAAGRGVLLFSGHYGHWELVALMQGHLGLPLALVTRPLDNPLLEERLARLRGLSGNVIIHRRGAVRQIVQTLRRGWGVAIVIDQDAHQRGVFVPFFGRPASTTPTLAAVALKTGAAVVPVCCLPLPDGSYRVIYEPALRVASTGDHEADVTRLTAACTAIIERWVRRSPEFWLWMHRRWKTPEPVPGAGGRHEASDPDGP